MPCSASGRVKITRASSPSPPTTVSAWPPKAAQVPGTSGSPKAIWLQPLALLGAPDTEAGVGHLDQLQVRRALQRVAEAHHLAGNQRGTAHRLEPQPEGLGEVRDGLVDIDDQGSDVEERNVLGVHDAVSPLDTSHASGSVFTPELRPNSTIASPSPSR